MQILTSKCCQCVVHHHTIHEGDLQATNTFAYLKTRLHFCDLLGHSQILTDLNRELYGQNGSRRRNLVGNFILIYIQNVNLEMECGIVNIEY
jgi:hypothetical protein